MAKKEHLAILEKGVKAWNQWRKENPDIRPDLYKADLRKANLRDADLRKANLRKTDLRRANLIEANLIRADLIRADLIKANLRRANLRGAYLGKADLNGANLIEADLFRADLHGADLREALLFFARFDGANLTEINFDKSRMGHTSFSNINLSQAIGLKTVLHSGPSHIDLHTLYQSQGRIPESFLRGAGVEDRVLAYIPSLFGGSMIQYYSCFISYSSKDQEFAERLYESLQAQNVRCWFAPEDLKIGDEFREEIDKSIRLHDKLLVVLSANSVQSEWVGDEVESALEQEGKKGRHVLFPVRIDGAVLDSGKAWASKIRRRRHIGDFSEWKDHDAYQKAFARLLRDLKANGAPPEEEQDPPPESSE